jgi:hypothetical protein
MGIAHQAIVTAHPDVNLVAVCDVLALMEKCTGAKTYSDYRKCRYNTIASGLLSKCDLPLNCHPAAVRVSGFCAPSGAGQPLRLGNVHAAEFGLPIVDRRFGASHACEPGQPSSPQPHAIAAVYVSPQPERRARPHSAIVADAKRSAPLIDQA